MKTKTFPWIATAVGVILLLAGLLPAKPGKAKPQRPNVQHNIVERL